MLIKIARNKSKISKKFIVWKLKKKWRFWRSFKFYFLRQKKKFFFPRISWLFNQKRIIWHQLSVIYGKKIKNQAYSHHKSKFLFNSRFGSLLTQLEIRLNIVLLRLCFTDKLQKANEIIESGNIRVNSAYKHSRYLLSKGDLIIYNKRMLKKRKLKMIRYFRQIRTGRLKRMIWRKLKKYPVLKKGIKKKNRNYIFSLRRNFIFNFMEINYRCFSAILLRYPLLGEISYRNKKRLLTSTLLNKIYFLY
jgi:ribosomal protein S4